jgi:hypothetical protein
MRGALTAIVAFAAHFASAEQPSERPYNPCLEGGVRETVVFLGANQTTPGQAAAQPIFFGTGFLIQVEGLIYLVTARHVIEGYLRREKGTPPWSPP